MSKSLGYSIVIVCILIVSGMIEESEALECPSHTVAQHKVIENAYYHGLPNDLGYTLAAITVQESFVGPYIVRVNNKDGKYGSYGVTHVLLETAMDLEGYKSSWRARGELVPKLISDDEYVMSLSVNKLLRYRDRGWIKMVRKYNGTGIKAKEYGDKIVNHVLMLKKCYKFKK